jgi:hypothetical protein
MPQLTKSAPHNLNRDGNGGYTLLQYLYEILFATDIAFAIASVALRSWTLFRPFAHLEIKLNQLLGIQQTDFIRGYIAITTASLLLAALFWAVLRISAQSKLTMEFLRSVSGFIVLFAPAAFWICVYEQDGWPVGWPYRGAPLEIIIILFGTFLFLSQKIAVAPNFVIVTVLAAHYFYWYWAPSTNPAMPNYAGPVAPIIGFCSALTWIYYVNSLRQNQPSADVG